MGRTCIFIATFLLAVPFLPHPDISGTGGAPLSPPQEFPPGFQIDRDNWETPVDPGQSIRIENLHGDVRVRCNEIPRLDVFVVIQLQEQDSLRANVRIVEAAEGLKVDVRYVVKDTGDQTEEAGDASERMDSSENRPDLIRRVDMTVYVPVGSALDIRTEDGTIEARNLKSDVVADTVGGEVIIITAGSASARSATGSILVVLLTDDSTNSSRLETKTGDIVLQVPDDLNVLVRAGTSGTITHEYEAETSSPGDDRFREATVRVGTGKHEVEIKSETGNVDILAWTRERTGIDALRTQRAIL